MEDFESFKIQRGIEVSKQENEALETQRSFLEALGLYERDNPED